MPDTEKTGMQKALTIMIPPSDTSVPDCAQRVQTPVAHRYRPSMQVVGCMWLGSEFSRGALYMEKKSNQIKLVMICTHS